MATEDISLVQFQTELGEAKTALAAGNVVTAKQKAALAQMTLSGLIGSQSMAGRSHQLQQDQLANVLAAIDAYEQASGGNTRLVPVMFGRPS